jgi:hypothetical protein
MSRWGRSNAAGRSPPAVRHGLAWDPALEREVALKVLPAGTRTVIQEGRLLARVRHPNVVTVCGIDEYGEPWFVDGVGRV